MSGYLLDTNVLSEILKKRPEPRVIERLAALPSRAVATSVICVAELRHGAARRPQHTGLWTRIARDVLPRVSILPIHEAEAIRAGDLLASLESMGKPIGLEDVLIGATALENRLAVVTRNTRHFRQIPGLAVESWWPDAAAENDR